MVHEDAYEDLEEWETMVMSGPVVKKLGRYIVQTSKIQEQVHRWEIITRRRVLVSSYALYSGLVRNIGCLLVFFVFGFLHFEENDRYQCHRNYVQLRPE
ncbi:hypothetical protein VNO78_12233 [Psophocarpus tetragonolobus]|uniref:Uncharacterized protein n=1 Tax=Psophocarpus tetragonolobus TaxID=3891 RepID=A0AAN9SV57_PSOTE